MTFTLSPDWAVLILEDTDERIAWFKERLPRATYAKTATAAITALNANSYRVVFLDHDLDWMHAADSSIVKGTGKEVAAHLKKIGFTGIVVIHSKNEDGVKVMTRILPSAKVARFGEFDLTVG